MASNTNALYRQCKSCYDRGENWTPGGARCNNGAHCPGMPAEQSRLFSGIPPGDYSAIYSAARIRELARGDMLYLEGDQVQQVWLLTSGCVKITQLGASGTEAILRVGVPGDVLDAVGLFSASLHRTTAQPFRLCRALIWDAATFKGLVERYPVLYQNMVQILGDQISELEERFREVATERVAPRVALQIVRLLDKLGQPVDGAIEISLSRQELAEMTGTTLFTVSRLFSAWEARGWVRPRREGVVVCDVEALRAIAE